MVKKLSIIILQNYKTLYSIKIVLISIFFILLSPLFRRVQLAFYVKIAQIKNQVDGDKRWVEHVGFENRSII